MISSLESLLDDDAFAQAWRRYNLFWSQLPEIHRRADSRIAAGEPCTSVDRVAFQVQRHSSVLHFKSTWDALDKNTFDVVLFEDGFEPDLYDWLAEAGYRVVLAEDADPQWTRDQRHPALRAKIR